MLGSFSNQTDPVELSPQRDKKWERSPSEAIIDFCLFSTSFFVTNVFGDEHRSHVLL